MITFPLHPIVDGRCACGCKNAGKHPIDSGWQKLTESIPHTDGYGVQTGERSGVFVVDCDSEDAAADFLEQFAPSETRTVQTGKGWHFYFQWPDFTVKNSVKKIGPGIDVRGKGGYVVGAGSPHVSGKSYVLVNDVPPAKAPEALLDFLRGGPPAEPGPTGGGEDKPEHVRWFRELCVSHPPAVQGENGSGTLFDLCQNGTRSAELTDDCVIREIEALYNARCVPPWSHEEIARCVRNSRERGQFVTGTTAMELAREKRKKPAPVVDAFALAEVANGKIQKCTISELAVFLVTDPDWLGVLAYDELHDTIVYRRPPPYAAEGTFEEHHATKVRVWLETQKGRTCSKETAFDAVTMIARETVVHPVREYLESLPRAVPGTIQALARVLNPDATTAEYTYLRKTLIGAYRRIVRPGTQLDTMLILVGPQGVGKSTTLHALFGKEFCGILFGDLGNKDAAAALVGVWAVEMAELAHVGRTAVAQEKNFLSKHSDRYRPAYARTIVDRPRQCVFIGTTNDDDFLKDETGERRKLIFRTPVAIDRAKVAALRDLVWSEARAAAEAGESHWLDEKESGELAELQKNFISEEANHDAVLEYLKGRDRVPSAAKILEALYPDTAKQPTKKSDELAISRTLKRLGCVKKPMRDGKFWIIPDSLAKATPNAIEASRQAREKQQNQKN